MPDDDGLVWNILDPLVPIVTGTLVVLFASFVGRDASSLDHGLFLLWGGLSLPLLAGAWILKNDPRSRSPAVVVVHRALAIGGLLFGAAALISFVMGLGTLASSGFTIGGVVASVGFIVLSFLRDREEAKAPAEDSESAPGKP